MKKREIIVMVNGLPGNMAVKVCEHIVKADEKLYPFTLYGRSLTGPEIEQTHFEIKNGFSVELFRPDERDKLLKMMTWHNKYTFVAVDFSHPSAVNMNAEFYCAHKIPFVMGTTGGDRERLVEVVAETGNCAVIAPNMAKQIVAFQAMMEFAGKNFRNSFRGFTLEIVESHQQGKADTSGTAKAMVDYFNLLGIPFSKEQIVMVRDPEQQRTMGIPEEDLKGHGWHTYTLRSPDGSIFFQFTHNVNGRDIYALGALDAINFLAENIQPEVVYSMMDVLKGA
ncbi:dihydrodipicolinate reductase [Patescibacteria group bacterium]|nr:dihydrodipicolinate reductase [Patescibacteria group bacterium]